MEDRVIQFEIWNECNNNCKFCSNKFVYNITDEEIKMLPMGEKILKILKK